MVLCLKDKGSKFLLVSATVFNILNYTFSNYKAHYEVIMNNKVFSLMKEVEAHYQELEEDHLVRLMPFQRYSGK